MDLIWTDPLLDFRGIGSRDTIHFNAVALFMKKGFLILYNCNLYEIYYTIVFYLMDQFEDKKGFVLLLSAMVCFLLGPLLAFYRSAGAQVKRPVVSIFTMI